MSLLLVLAYLDPGSGSLLIQALVGGTAGLVVFVRYLWTNWRHVLYRRRPANVPQ